MTAKDQRGNPLVEEFREGGHGFPAGSATELELSVAFRA